MLNQFVYVLHIMFPSKPQKWQKSAATNCDSTADMERCENNNKVPSNMQSVDIFSNILQTSEMFHWLVSFLPRTNKKLPSSVGIKSFCRIQQKMSILLKRDYYYALILVCIASKTTQTKNKSVIVLYSDQQHGECNLYQDGRLVGHCTLIEMLHTLH